MKIENFRKKGCFMKTILVPGGAGYIGSHTGLDLLKKGLGGILLGDLLMRLRNAVKPYEKKEGETDRLKSYYIDSAGDTNCQSDTGCHVADEFYAIPAEW